MALTRIKTDQVLDGTITNADLASDIALNTSGNITTSGDISAADISAANVTLTGELNGPATFYIDPSPHDPDTDGSTNGLVVIRGDLQIDGTTTTVNSTTMDVADLNITLASGAANAAAADGAGLTVDGASATILYDGTNDEWDFNKDIHVDTILTDTGIVHAGDTDTYIKFLSNRIYSDVGGNRILDAQAGDVKINGPDGSAGIAIDTGGYVGIGGVTNPTRNLHVETADAIPLRIEGESDGAISYSEFVNASTSDVGNGVGIEFRALTTTQERQLFYVQSSWSDNTDADRESLTRIFTSGGGSQKNPLTIVGDKVGIGTGANTPDTLLHISATSPHIDIGPKGGNRGKIGYHDLDVIIGSTSSTGEIIFKNNIGSTDSPQDSGDVKMVIGDTNVGIGVETPESRLTVGTNAITTLKPTAVFVDGANGGSVTIRGLSPTLAFDKTGTNASARILLDGGALQFRDGDLDQTDPNQTNSVTSNLLMVLSHDGKLGIGNFGDGNTAPYYIDPSYQLHVKGAGDIKIEDDTGGGSAHLRIGASTSGTRDSEWKVKVSGSDDEFHIDHDYTAGGVSVGTTAFKISGATHSLYNDNDQPTIRPTLNLDFANSKQLDPRITFNRESIGSYYDNNRVLRYAVNNEPRFDHNPATGESKGLLIEESRTNRVDQSSYYHMGEWGDATSTDHHYVFNAAKAPDGTYTATKIVPGESSSRKGIYSTTLTVSSGWQVFSTYAKAAGYDTLLLSQIFGSNSSGYGYKFRLDNGTYSQVTTPSVSTIVYMEDVGDGWYRCSVAFENTNGTNYANIFVGDSTDINSYDPFWRTVTGSGDRVSGILIWGTQYESGVDNPSSYIKSDVRFLSRSSRASYHDENGLLKIAPQNSPRYGYKFDGEKWVDAGLILELASTNIFGYSNDFDDDNSGGGAWEDNQSGANAIRTTAVTSPEGIYNATFLREDSATTNHFLRETFSEIAGTYYCFSLYAKANQRDELNLNIGASRLFGKFDLTNGTVLEFGDNNTNFTNGTAEIENVGDGWYRCAIRGYSVNAGSNYVRIALGDGVGTGNTPSYTGDGSSGLYIYGAQLETGNRVTTYIPTYGGSATRSADVISSGDTQRKADDCFMPVSDWYNQDQGTLYVEHNVDRDITSDAWGIVTIENEGSTDDYIGIRYRSTGTTGEVLSLNGSSEMSASSISAADLNYFNKSAFAFATNDAAAVGNGGTVSTDTTVTLPKLTRMTIGDGEGINYIGGHIKNIKYYPKRLGNAELIALTEND